MQEKKYIEKVDKIVEQYLDKQDKVGAAKYINEAELREKIGKIYEKTMQKRDTISKTEISLDGKSTPDSSSSRNDETKEEVKTELDAMSAMVSYKEATEKLHEAILKRHEDVEHSLSTEDSFVELTDLNREVETARAKYLDSSDTSREDILAYEEVFRREESNVGKQSNDGKDGQDIAKLKQQLDSTILEIETLNYDAKNGSISYEEYQEKFELLHSKRMEAVNEIAKQYPQLLEKDGQEITINEAEYSKVVDDDRQRGGTLNIDNVDKMEQGKKSNNADIDINIEQQTSLDEVEDDGPEIDAEKLAEELIASRKITTDDIGDIEHIREMVIERGAKKETSNIDEQKSPTEKLNKSDIKKSDQEPEKGGENKNDMASKMVEALQKKAVKEELNQYVENLDESGQLDEAVQEMGADNVIDTLNEEFTNQLGKDVRRPGKDVQSAEDYIDILAMIEKGYGSKLREMGNQERTTGNDGAEVGDI